LDKDRDASDQRVEKATAAVLVVLDARSVAERALEAVTTELATALRELLGEGVDAERAAALLELDATEVRRLTKPVAAEKPSATAKPVARVTVLPDTAGGVGGERQVG
jgi:hypothetical protein